MSLNILCRNLHTGPRQGKELGSIVSYCVCPVPLQCKKAIILTTFAVSRENEYIKCNIMLSMQVKLSNDFLLR